MSRQKIEKGEVPPVVEVTTTTEFTGYNGILVDCIRCGTPLIAMDRGGLCHCPDCGFYFIPPVMLWVRIGIAKIFFTLE